MRYLPDTTRDIEASSAVLYSTAALIAFHTHTSFVHRQGLIAFPSAKTLHSILLPPLWKCLIDRGTTHSLETMKHLTFCRVVFLDVMNA